MADKRITIQATRFDPEKDEKPRLQLGDCDLVVDGNRPVDDLAQHVWSAIAADEPIHNS